MSFLTKERKNKKEEKMIRLEPRLVQEMSFKEKVYGLGITDDGRMTDKD